MEHLRKVAATNHPSKRMKPTSDHQYPSDSTQDSSSLALPFVPDEIIFKEILTRLPVKSLLIFKCVSKSWLSLISNPQFIKAHLEFSRNVSTKSEKKRLLIKRFFDWRYYIEYCSLTSLLFEEPADETTFCYPYLEGHFGYNVLVGTVNGLVCIDGKQNGVVLWNPATGKSKKLPDFFGYKPVKSDFYTVFGFGYDEINDDYKVVGFICPHEDDEGEPFGVPEVKFYSIKTESWRRIGDLPVGNPQRPSCGNFLNGKLHWSVKQRDSQSVGFLDLATEEFGEMEIPNFEKYSESKLDTFKGSLCLICRHNYEYTDLWIMKEYGMRDSWIKLLHIPTNYYRMCLVSQILYTSENGKILLMSGHYLTSYNPKDESFTHYQIGQTTNRNKHVALPEEACVYVESLISPTADGAPEEREARKSRK